MNLVTCGRNFVHGCSNLTEIHIPAKVNRFGNGAFQNTQNLKKVYCYAPTAPAYADNGSIFSATYASSMGYNTRTAGTNEWHVPVGAAGYEAGVYINPLRETSRCGFTVIYDLWHIPAINESEEAARFITWWTIAIDTCEVDKYIYVWIRATIIKESDISAVSDGSPYSYRSIAITAVNIPPIHIVHIQPYGVVGVGLEIDKTVSCTQCIYDN